MEKTCSDCSACFSEEEKRKLKDQGWTEEQINFAEGSIIEDKVKECVREDSLWRKT